MEELQRKILKEGRILSGGILKVDSFLNHQIDPRLMRAIGEEFAKHFANEEVNKILTVESSGIAIALMTGLALGGIPVVYAKKQKPKNMSDHYYHSEVMSYTRGAKYQVVVANEYLSSDDRILIIDDFLARGQATKGLCDIIEQSGASLAGIGITIEKAFQEGGVRLRERGIKLVSLARVEVKKGKVTFI